MPVNGSSKVGAKPWHFEGYRVQYTRNGKQKRVKVSTNPDPVHEHWFGARAKACTQTGACPDLIKCTEVGEVIE